MKLTMAAPAEMSRRLGRRARALRLLRNLTQRTLAGKAGVSLGSLKRFETTGQASLELVMKVAHALGRLEDFDDLLEPPPARSMEELERRAERPAPQRGRL